MFVDSARNTRRNTHEIIWNENWSRSKSFFPSEMIERRLKFNETKLLVFSAEQQNCQITMIASDDSTTIRGTVSLVV